MAGSLLGSLLRDADPIVQTRASAAVGHNQCGANYAQLLIDMRHGDPPVSTLTSVAYAMGCSGHPPFVPNLVNHLRHEEVDVRSTVLFELTRLVPETAFEHNVRLLGDPEASVRRGALQNLAMSHKWHRRENVSGVPAIAQEEGFVHTDSAARF